MALFKQHAHSCYIYIMSGETRLCSGAPWGLSPMPPGTNADTNARRATHAEVFKMFGRDPATFSVMSQAYQSVVTDCIARIKNLRECEQRPDLVDDLYLMARRCLNYCPAAGYWPATMPLLVGKDLPLPAQGTSR